ncbi:MAG: L-threonylcarbamoyladenylate synthase [Acidobacteriota bacterium]|nr:L-threonylcarbamoyladenylate synthase [Acidobacteriota bacterium]
MDHSLIHEAARLIRAGQLVAFPTETVYGLGANAFDPAAIHRVYVAKERPHTSPLIVHAASLEMALGLVREWPERAEKLARLFWPGPLTLVLSKSDAVPEGVTGGLDTVAIRVPSHPIALELIQAAGVPIAAPSANRFTQLSPTTAEHVRQSLGDRVAMVLDGGPCEVGIESTVLSLVGNNALLLRPGMISQADLEHALGSVQVDMSIPTGAHPSPGMHAKHYSPITPLVLVQNAALPETGKGAYLWIREPARADHAVEMPIDATAYAANLYAVLHQVDVQGWDWIAVERPPSGTVWAGIRDRLERSAATGS